MQTGSYLPRRGTDALRAEEIRVRTKVYVTVSVEFDQEGLMLPRSLVWEDGHRYVIDRVKDIRQAAAMKAGGQGDRYTVIINGRQSYLYFERNGSRSGNNLGRWFVERKGA